MKKTMNKPELLAPVQDWKALKEVAGLTDSIYFGVEDFNMRANAKNFKANELRQIVDFCRNSDPPMKAYLCTNIIIYDNELDDLDSLLWMAKDAEIDAVIVHDIAAINRAKKYNIPFHISTQANISNIEAALFYEKLGAERLILARELSLKQIKVIKSKLKKTKIECFVHGSMCTSISGRCYFSATICDSAEFSANRGKCVQPCRRKWRVIDDENHEFIYDGLRFLNAKDLCMIEFIPELIEANIDAFKIEGRMKDALYSKVVTKCYREAIDSYFEGTFNEEKVKKWMKKLARVYNRGFHTGFYFKRPTADDIEFFQDGSVSPYEKKYLGDVLSYDESSNSANIEIINKNIPLTLGSDLIIDGPETFSIEKVKKIIIKGKKVNSVIRRENDEKIKINMPISGKAKIGDKVYIISKRLYYCT